MEIRYYKEQHRNFMVIRQTESENQAAYHSKMLRSRNMQHLLKVNERIVDGNKYNYYDITSKLSIKQLQGSRNLTMEDLKPFFRDLRGACKEIDNYLLDAARLVLNPDMIFYDHVKAKFCFLYNISTPVSESENDLGLLMDFLLDKVDGEDEVLSDLIYRLYEQYEKGILDIWNIFDIYDDYAHEDDPNTTSHIYAEASSKEYPDNSRTHTAYSQDNDPYTAQDPVPFPAPFPPAAQTKTEQKSILPILAAVTGIIGVSACIAIRLFFRLEPDEKLILTAGTIASGIISVASLAYLLISHKNKQIEEPQPDSIVSLPEQYAGEIHMQDFVASPVIPRKPVAAGSKQEHSNDEDDYAPSIEGQTVFFDGTSESGTYKLYALDRKNKKHIELDHLPVTIGKLNGYVDYVIDHPSISRMHARLDLQDNKLMLADLNSTNGVYLNGMRLSPNEVREIEEGDEIRFGSLNYCLRRCC